MITLEDLKKMFENKEKELTRKEFEKFVNEFWTSQQGKSAERLEHNKSRLDYLRERKKILKTHIELLKIEVDNISAKENQYKKEIKDLKDYLKK